MFKTRLVAAVSLCLLMAATADAQRRSGRSRSRGGGLNSRFAQGPNVGEQLPDLALFDSDGKPVKLRSLKGEYTVLVFGCLT